MKKSLLIFLLILLPWQAFAAVERQITHILGSVGGQVPALIAQHIAEHEAHIMHHHDDDDDHDEDDQGASANGVHVDQSAKSAQHLADYEQGSSLNLLFPAASNPGTVSISSSPPAILRDSFGTRTILPLLRPPRVPA